MKKINLKVRIRNPVFLAQTAGAIIVPILAYMGLTLEDLTSWSLLGKAILEAISNPYVVGMALLSIFNALNDPTTKGIHDHESTLILEKPKHCTQKLEQSQD